MLNHLHAGILSVISSCILFSFQLFENKVICSMVSDSASSFCRYVPSFIPPPLATKGREYEKKVSAADEKFLIDHLCFLYMIFILS